jgi:hypothetical protein
MYVKGLRATPASENVCERVKGYTFTENVCERVKGYNFHRECI